MSQEEVGAESGGGGDAPAELGGSWQKGLFGCFGDCKVCIITYFVPCVTAGKVAESVGESCVKFAIFAMLPIAGQLCGAKIRTKVRETKGIAGSFGMDCVMHIFCAACALCQEAQEMNAFAKGIVGEGGDDNGGGGGDGGDEGGEESMARE